MGWRSRSVEMILFVLRTLSLVIIPFMVRSVFVFPCSSVFISVSSYLHTLDCICYIYILSGLYREPMEQTTMIRRDP